MAWYWQLLIIIGAFTFLVGYCWGVGNVYKYMMDDHPDPHSSHYITTNGFTSLMLGVLWPLMALGVAIKLLVRLFRPTSVIAKAGPAEMLLGIIFFILPVALTIRIIISVAS